MTKFCLIHILKDRVPLLINLGIFLINSKFDSIEALQHMTLLGLQIIREGLWSVVLLIYGTIELMRLTLIKPRLGHGQSQIYQEKALMEPHALTIVASLTPDDVDVVFYDDRIEAVRFDEKTDLVAITVDMFTARRAIKISSEYRKRGIPVIMGGHYPTLAPREAKKFCDSVFMGDAEALWPKVISDARENNLQALYNSRTDIPQVRSRLRRDIYRSGKYLKPAMVQFSRGCKVGCSFCSISSFYQNNFFHRKVEDVVAEIRASKRRFVAFLDDNIIYNHSAARQLFSELIPLKIKWASQSDISIARDPDLLELAVESGCQGLLIGFESIVPDNLRSMNKKVNLHNFNGYLDKISAIREAGIMIWAAFTFGHDYDTPRVFEETVEFCISNRFLMADFNILHPYPGTPFYHQLRDENRLLYDGQWWLHPDYRYGKATYIPKKMSPGELERGCNMAYDKFLNYNSLLRRAFDFKTHMRSVERFFTFCLCNYFSYHGNVKKRNIILGAA